MWLARIQIPLLCRKYLQNAFSNLNQVGWRELKFSVVKGICRVARSNSVSLSNANLSSEFLILVQNHMTSFDQRTDGNKGLDLDFVCSFSLQMKTVCQECY